MSHDKIDDAMAINYESDLAHWKKRAIDAESALAAQQSQQEPTEPVAWFPLLGTGLAIRRNLLNEEFAQRNHSQTLTRLAERGGLSIDEAVANISRTQWKSRETKDALAELAKLTAPLSGVRERIALQELRNIVNAKRFDVEVFDDDTAFADWAQSRARHAITRAADQVNEDSYSAGVDRDRAAGIYRDTVPVDQVNESQPETVQAVKEDAPVMKAWNNYKSCDEFKNTRKWALHNEHVDGSLWASFYAGFFACAVYEVNTAEHEKECQCLTLHPDYCHVHAA